jgi:glycosyltransferase involved in cell wall biosynthesis
MSERINFNWVSPYHPDDAQGGWKGMQFHLLKSLEAKLGTARRIAPVEVVEEFWAKWLSRLQKKLKIPRRYVHYSETRLADFASLVQQQLPENDGQPVVFFGALPFVSCRPKSPYYLYTDGAFFIHYWEYNQDHTHHRKEIERILRAEAEFMRGAGGVWCSSQNVADRITREYGLAAGKALFVGTGPGNVPPAEAIRYENSLVMIAGDFERKGGRLAVQAVAEARKLGASIQLKLIGAKPPEDVLGLGFVEWCGWLDLRKQTDRKRFADLMSGIGAQILLSRSDLTPLVITEAASYAKATFATAVGGIPEMIRNEETGWITSPTATPLEIGQRLAAVFEHSDRLKDAGLAARDFCLSKWSWESVANTAVSNMTNTGCSFTLPNN